MNKIVIVLLVVATFFVTVVTPVAAQTDTATCVAPLEFQPFTPNADTIGGMNPVGPQFADFLTAHNLSAEQIQEYTPANAVWEPAMYVVELTESLYGKFCLTMLEGFQYTVSLPDGRVEVFFGGDPNLESVPVLWGFTARYVPGYQAKLYGLGGWLNIVDPTELAVREHRYGRYLQNQPLDEGNEYVPFFTRFGPYYVGTGNLAIDWVPPALTAVEPRDFRDAAAMLGGLAIASEWTYDAETKVWVWKYTGKVPGDANYCPPTDSCWQTVYVPSNSDGYVEIWVGSGPAKFGADDLATLTDGQHNVDEFSYHPNPDDN